MHLTLYMKKIQINFFISTFKNKNIHFFTKIISTLKYVQLVAL